jgi:hypothetical protein
VIIQLAKEKGAGRETAATPWRQEPDKVTSAA